MIIPILFFLFFGFTGLILWFKMLDVLKSKGQSVNSFFVTPRQYIAFIKVIKKETDLTLKRKYLILIIAQIILIPIYFIVMFVVVALTVQN